jgi:hypothetical protein
VRLHVITESGSEYVLDWDAQTWTRVEDTERSGALRTDGTGPFWSVATSIGLRFLIITGPPVNELCDMRMVRTSSVVRWWEEGKEVSDAEEAALR